MSGSEAQSDYATAESGSHTGDTADSQVSIGDWECVAYNSKLLTAVWLFLDLQSRFNLRCASLELKEDLEDSISLELA